MAAPDPTRDRDDDAQRHALLQSSFVLWSADVFGFVLARSGNRAIAEDVTTEVFLAAARAIGGDDPAQVTRSWLLTTARRRLIDQWRRSSVQRNTVARLVHEPASEPSDPTSIDRERVHRALAALSDPQRLALTLRYLDDHSVAEVADALELGYTAAESLLARARRSFRRAWEKQ